MSKDYQFLECQPIKGQGGHLGFQIHIKSNNTWYGPQKEHLCEVCSRSLQLFLRS